MNYSERVDEMQWFHAIDFGDFGSSGRHRKGSPQNASLYGTFEYICAMKLDGATILDLGTVDGIVAFGAKRLGASMVVAADTHDRKTFRLAREILGYSEDDIRYVPGIQIKDLTECFEPKFFDLVVCSGIFYHMLHPMQAFTECRKVLGDGGYLIMETVFDDKRDDAVLVFNGVEHKLNEPYSYFIPTRSALVGMANLAGFQVIATRVLTSPRRITILLKAVDRGQLCASEEVPPFIKQMLKRDTCDNSFRHRDLEKDMRHARQVVGSVLDLPTFRQIEARSETVTFPYHLANDDKGLGSTVWEEVTGNTRIL